jgi:hypothetical protein
MTNCQEDKKKRERERETARWTRTPAFSSGDMRTEQQRKQTRLRKTTRLASWRPWGR